MEVTRFAQQRVARVQLDRGGGVHRPPILVVRQAEGDRVEDVAPFGHRNEQDLAQVQLVNEVRDGAGQTLRIQSKNAGALPGHDLTVLAGQVQMDDLLVPGQLQTHPVVAIGDLVDAVLLQQFHDFVVGDELHLAISRHRSVT